MAANKAILSLAPSVAAFILLYAASPVSADAVATIQVDGANVTVDNEVCETAAWRSSSLYATVTPAAQIKFESRYDAPYYQQHMKPKVVPNLILLIVFVLLFLFFIFWRWIYCCCQCCCNLCKPSETPMKYIRDRGMKTTKIFAILMAIGVVASSIFGMTQAGAHLVDQTVHTLGLFTGFADEVFEAAYNITSDADLALGIFDDLIVILNVDVNVSGMNTDIQCASTWLSGMVDPTVIADGLVDLQPIVTSTHNQIATINTDLTGYAAVGGDYAALTSSSLSAVTGSSSTYNSYKSAANTFKTQCQAIPSSATATTPAIQACGNALIALTDSAGTLGTHYTDINTIHNGLLLLEQLQYDAAHTTLSGSSTPSMLKLQQDLTALQAQASDLLYHRLPFLISDLGLQYSGYATVQPCMDTLLYQIEHINETVIALPPAMALSYELLYDLDSAYEALMTGADTNPQTLSAALAAYRVTLGSGTPLSPFTADMNNTILQLGNINAQLTATPVPSFTSLAADVSTLATHTSDQGSASGAYQSVAAAYTAYNIYVASQTSAHYNVFYSDIQVAIGGGAGINPVLNDLSTLTTTDSGYTTQAAAITSYIVNHAQGLNLLPTAAALGSVLSAISTAEAAIPPLAPYIVAEGAEGVAYDQLPTPKNSVLNAISSVVTDLDNKIRQTTTMVRADISDYNNLILSKIVTLHNDTVDRVNAKVDSYMPQVRKYDHMRMTGEYVYFAVVVFIAIMIAVVVGVNHQWGASFFTFLMLIGMLIYCIIGTVLLLLAVVARDECGNAETQIFTLIDKVNINSNSFNATLLANYYLNAEGGSLNAVAKNAAGVDFVAMQNTINITISDTITGITGAYTLRYKMQNEMTDIYDLGQLLLADVGGVRELVQFESVHPLYLSTKELACCDVVDVVGNLWLAMFMAGWFAAALMLAMMCYIRRLDELPKKRCCGCAFRSYKEFLEPEDKKLAAIKNKGKYMPAGREGSAPGTPGAVSVNAIKVQSNGSLAGGLITGVSGMSSASFDSTQPIKAGVEQFNSDGTPRGSVTPRASSYLAPESARAERSTDSQNRASLLGLQPLSVEASGGSLLSSGANKKGSARKSFTSKTEEKKDAMKKAMRMNQLG